MPDTSVASNNDGLWFEQQMSPPATIQYLDRMFPSTAPYSSPTSPSPTPTPTVRTIPQTTHTSLPSSLSQTGIRATDLALGLRRIPAGFYAVVYHSALEWRTENKRVCVNNDVVEWNGHIPIPPDPSAIVQLEIYASFELQPVLGCGEQLRKLSITAEQLLHCNERALAFTFLPEHGDVISPCSSVELTVGKCEYPANEPLASTTLGAHSPTAKSRDPIEDATDQGHRFLLRYKNHGEKQDLDRSIEQFERACPLDHPCRAAAQSNIAMAKFIQYQVNDSHDNDLTLDIPLTLYCDALYARPVGHPDRPFTLIHLATVYFARFEKGKDEVDAKRAEELLDEAKSLTSEESHENRAATFMLQLHAGRKTGDDHPSGHSPTEPDSTPRLPDENALTLGMQFLDRFERSGALGDLQQAISILEAYVSSTTPRDEKYLLGLTNMGMVFLYRFNCLGELGDLDNAISKFKEVVGFVPDVHPQKPGWLSNLGNALLTRFEQLQKLGDLEQAISSLKHAVDLIPDGHPQKVFCLSNLGNSFLTRFEHLGKLEDLEDAISRFKGALELTSDGHLHRPVFIKNLGSAYSARFERLGEPSDLEQAVLIFKDVISLVSDDDPLRPDLLNDLGNCLFALFERFGRLSDLEQAMSRNEDAVDLTPDGHPKKPARLNALGNCLQVRFERLEQLNDLEQAISRFSSAVELTPDGLSHKYGYLNNLGSACLARFKYLGNPDDLERAISRCRGAVDLTPDGHPYKPAYLSDLGRSLISRFERFGELSDLEEAISRNMDAVDLTLDGHIEKPGRLQILGNAFKARFERLGDLCDLDQAFMKHENAVALTPDDHPDKATRLSSLGNSFRTRFDRLGELKDLEQAISIQRDAIDMTPDGHPNKPNRLVCLAISLRDRFECIGDLSDLEQVISSLKDVTDVIPDDHALKPICLNTLAISFLSRFDRLGELGNLEQAILMFKDVDRLIPNDHPQKPGCLNNLGHSLKVRFDWLEELSDLEQSVSRLLDAVNLSHNDSHHKHILNTLGNSLFARFEHSGELSDLEQAILRHGEAVDFTPDGHPAKPGYLTNHGNSFEARFKCLGELSDIAQAISRHEGALALTPDGHPDKPGRLNNLGNSLKTRFDRLDKLQDLEQAISRFRDAIDLTPDDHPDKPGCLNNLASSLFIRFERLQQVDDREQVISLYSHAARASTGPTITRFAASEQWIFCARTFGHHSLLDAYSYTIGLLPQLAWMGFPLTRRYRELLRRADVVREAAAAALESGQMQTAVEWLEQGRSIIWGGLFQLRSSYEELESDHPHHAHRLRQLSAALERASATRERSLSLLSEHAQDTVQTLEQEADRHRKLAIERDALLEEVRRLPGFERFLLHKDFSQLRASAHSGPIVILNTAERRCDALIVIADKDVMHVPFPNFTLKRLEGFQMSLKSMLLTREGQRARLDHTKKWKIILSLLWKFIVKPVLEALEISTPGNPSRVFWCPTGPFTFIPIHAAGLYDEQYSASGHKLSDFVVSSYVPTLSVLSPSPKRDATSSGGLHFLAIRQPPTDGLRSLPGVDDELRYIEEVIQNAPLSHITLVESSVGTVEEVLELMKDADWVHFACHGMQDDDQPTNSGLCLADGRRLKLSDMIGLSRPRGGLAFLSACETAMGDKGLSDEAIHIAAGMLFAGYGSVVATMWSISDRIAPGLARDVYERLFRDGARPDAREAARAMQDAVVRVRDGGATFEEWLPFIHVGV